MWFLNCPRCDYVAYEVLKTHSYCYNCDFCPDDFEVAQPIIPKWALDAIRDLPDESVTPLGLEKAEHLEDEDSMPLSESA